MNAPPKGQTVRAHLLLPVLALAFLPAASCQPSGPAATGGNTEGGQATDFTITDIDGKTLNLSDYLGKKAVLIDFWATWCKPCTAEMVHLQKIYEARKEGFVVIAVSIDNGDTEAQVAPYIKSKGYTFPVVVDSDSRVQNLYNPRKAAPYAILIDKHGKIVKRKEGYNAGEEKQLETEIDAAMK